MADPAGTDFRLKQPTAAGLALAAEFAKDMFGNTRGADGATPDGTGKDAAPGDAGAEHAADRATPTADGLFDAVPRTDQDAPGSADDGCSCDLGRQHGLPALPGALLLLLLTLSRRRSGRARSARAPSPSHLDG